MFNFIANGKGGRGFKFTRDNTTVVYDGNSIGWGEGSTYAFDASTNGGQYGAYAVSQMQMFKEAGIRVQGFAVRARTTTIMIANIAQVKQLYDPRHFNLLIVDEITNELYSLSGTPSAMATATLAKILQYNNAARLGGQNWFIMWHAAIPRGVSAALNDATYNKNLALQLVNQALRDNPALYGVDRFIDSCYVGSPFRQFTNFTQAEFDAQAKYYRSRERAANNGGTYSFTANSTAGSINLTNVVPLTPDFTKDVLSGFTVTSSAISSGTLTTAANGIFDGLIKLTTATNLTTQTQATFNMTLSGFTNLHTHPSDLGYAIKFAEMERELRNLGTKLLLQ